MHGLSADTIDDTHVFTLSQVYEGLLLKMGEKGNDGGQFFTPREIIRAVVRVVAPKIGETVYDPGCGTGGFLAESYEFMAGRNNENIETPDELDAIEARHVLRPREREPDLSDRAGEPGAARHRPAEHLARQHADRRGVPTTACTQDAPAQFDVVLTNPPFGGKEGKEAQTQFAFKTGATQVLFLQHVIDSLKPTAAAAAWCWTKGSCSAPTKRPSCKPSASCWTSATCGASSACPAACSPRPAPA